MKRCFAIIICCLIIICVHAGGGPDWKQKAANPEYLHRAMKEMTDIMVHDIYSPPVASRTYAYISIAAYETAIAGNAQFRSLAGQLNGLKPMPAPQSEISPTLAAVHALLTVGKAMVVSEPRAEAFLQKMHLEFRKAGVPANIFKQSIEYGALVAKHILAWAGQDGYKETRSFEKYLVEDDAHTWKPTPPAYMRAVEPHWSRIRPFLLDSAQQFRPVPVTPFSAEKDSEFYKDAYTVYQAGKNLTPEQTLIANFWDCNPFKMNIKGHVMFASKKISPGGHWINIAALASQKAKADFQRSAEVYVHVSIAIADAFISCWEEKYRSNVIRPETYINQYIDESWTPLLQTPPFPEYTSGHSVISTAAAHMLTRLFGDDFAFDDSSEVSFGLPVRSFKSFNQAAAEAAISRLYGGIHYLPAIKNGTDQGEKIAQFLMQKLVTNNSALANIK